MTVEGVPVNNNKKDDQDETNKISKLKDAGLIIMRKNE
jgi:hypothetical protein